MINIYTKSKILFLWLDSTQFYPIQASKRGVKVADTFRKVSRPLEAVRRLQVETNLLSIYPWLNDQWVNELNQFETVIVHASRLTPPVVKFINTKYPEIKVIVWYWNPVDKCVPVKKFKKLKCEIWTFDFNDALKYKIRLNTQYYFKDIKLNNNEILTDIVFVGAEKGRLNSLLEIQKEMSILNLDTDFHIVKSSNKSPKNYKYKKKLTYLEILEKISKSNCILDIVSDKQSGLTLRPLESLYLGKKLITNDYNIVNLDFYNPNNIFILQYPKNKYSLEEFLKVDFEEPSVDLKHKYDFDTWLYRIMNNESM